ncbi:MAG: DUF1697 domain-containing protein [Planctomycetes bacterium]|nr:DUF1697 domain-containing protein [Planctomycetota bacterium]
MAATHIALLRGINVGKAKRIAMTDLRKVFESLGCRDVRTLQNSGNVVFEAPAGMDGGFGARVEEVLTRKIGVRARTTIIAARDLARILDENPLSEVATDSSRTLVALPRTPTVARRLKGLGKTDWTPDRFAMGARAAYLWCADGVLASKLWAACNKVVADDVTTRNWRTMQALGAMVTGPK